MDSLIFDRTQEDVTFALNNPSNENFLKGAYNYTDLNRIEQWCEYLANILTSYSYNVETDIKTNWTMSDFPTISELERIRTNVLNLKKAFVSFSQVPSNLENITYQKANDIERILNEIDLLLANAENYFVYSGVASAGQSRFWQNRFRRYDRKYFVELLGNSTQVVYESKNLFNKNSLNLLDSYYIGGGGLVGTTVGNKTYYMKIEPNTTYTISKMSSQRFRVGFFNNANINGQILHNSKINDTATNITVTSTDADTYLFIYCYNSNVAGEADLQDILDSIQVEKGTTATEYEPYVNMPSPDFPSEITKISGTASVDIGDVTKTITPLHDMYSIGNVADRIYTDGYGNWYDEKKCGIVELTGNEGWTYNSAQNAFWIRNTVISDSLNVAHQKLCTHFLYSNKIFSQAPINTLCENSVPEMPMFIFKIDTNVATTVDEWEAFLIEQNTNGAPVTVLYQLATPIITKITDTDMINTLDEIRDLMQNEGITSKNFY